MVKLLCLRNTFLSSIDKEARREREREESTRRLGAVLGEEPERNHWSGAEGGKSASRSQVSYANVRCTLLGVTGLNMCRYTHTLCRSGWLFCLWKCKAVQMGRGNSLKAE